MRVILVSNTSKSKVEKTDGKYKITGIPITVDNATMNRIKYPADENQKGMPTMVGKPMSLTHPEDKDGRNVSIFSPDGIDFYSGGKVSQTYNKDGTWYANADIDEKRLRATEQGEYFANRLDEGLPIGVSTGLTFTSNNESGEDYDMVAKNMEFDHLAMLHESEQPAGGDATVMRFNGEDVDVVNVESLIGSVGKIEQDEISEGLLTKIVNTVKAAFVNENKSGYNDTDLNTNEDRVMRNLIEAKLKAAGKEVEGLDEAALLDAYNSLEKPAEIVSKVSEIDFTDIIGKAVNAAVKPISEKLEKVESELTANKEDKLKGLREAVNKLDLGLPEVAVNAMGEADLTALVEKHGGSFASGYPAAVNARAANAKKGEDFSDVDLNAGLEG